MENSKLLMTIVAIIIIVVVFAILLIAIIYPTYYKINKNSKVTLNIVINNSMFYNLSVNATGGGRTLVDNISHSFSDYENESNRSSLIVGSAKLAPNTKYKIKVYGYMGPFCYSKYCINDQPDIVEKINTTLNLTTSKSGSVYNLTILGENYIKLKEAN